MNFQTTYQGGQLDRALQKSLPLLPGYSFNLNIGADRFNRSGHWAFNDGIGTNKHRVISEVEGYRPRKGIGADTPDYRPRPGIGGLLPPPWAPVRTGPDHSVFPCGHGITRMPTWLEFDKKMLVFDAYFQEPIPESGLENYRIHQCKIYFFLEDDTTQVMEPKTLNSGIPQGQIIRRHRIPLPAPCGPSQYYTLEHFNVGCEINLYGKVFVICGCDGWTRKFLNRLGIPVPHNMELPADQATEKLKDRKCSQFARKPHHCYDTRGPFILHSGHVLRFWAYWDDRCKLYGDLRQFVLHYYLTDGTIELVEILRPNSGYEAYPQFLRRSKIPKVPENLVGIPGEKTPLTILNVFGSMYGTKNKKAHYLVDNLGSTLDDDYYKDNDLAIGAVLNIYGRPFILTTCDEFTKTYYREKYGVEDFTPLELNEELLREIPPPIPPPWTGWGQEDDLGMWNRLEPRPAIKDYRKEAELAKDILRFEAKFHNPLQTLNKTRRFVINYYMSDETIQVFENEHPNSGLPKGTFIHRKKVKKPGHQWELGEVPEFYCPKDLYVGNILPIDGFIFQLTMADEFTLCYMEANKHLFPHADICICLEKFREAIGPLEGDNVLKCFAEHDTCLQGVVDTRNFRALILQISKCGLSEHEALTLTRCYAAKTPLPGPDFQTIQAVAQTELRRFNFDRILLARVEYTLRYHDACRSGRMDRETLRATLKGAKLPIFKDLLDYMVDKFPSPEDDTCNRVDYCCFLKWLDWEMNPVPIAKPAAIQCVMKWVEPKPPLKILCVNYRAFLEDVAPLIKCSYPAVCCCCKENKPCPQHPCQQPDNTDYCPQPESNGSQQQCLPPCEPQEPITVVLQPCSMTETEGNAHKCAPGAQKCFADQGQGGDDQGEPIPTFKCPPCGGDSGNNCNK